MTSTTKPAAPRKAAPKKSSAAKPAARKAPAKKAVVAKPAARRGRGPVKESSREVAAAIMRERGGEPMRVSELSRLVVESKRCNVTGKTPEASVAHAIYFAAKDGVLFAKVEPRGFVALLEAAVEAPPAS